MALMVLMVLLRAGVGTVAVLLYCCTAVLLYCCTGAAQLGLSGVLDAQAAAAAVVKGQEVDQAAVQAAVEAAVGNCLKDVEAAVQLLLSQTVQLQRHQTAVQ
jgi:hypothetical protein